MFVLCPVGALFNGSGSAVQSQMPQCTVWCVWRSHRDAAVRVSPALRASSLLDPAYDRCYCRDVVILRLCRALLLV